MSDDTDPLGAASKLAATSVFAAGGGGGGGGRGVGADEELVSTVGRVVADVGAVDEEPADVDCSEVSDTSLCVDVVISLEELVPTVAVVEPSVGEELVADVAVAEPSVGEELVADLAVVDPSLSEELVADLAVVEPSLGEELVADLAVVEPSLSEELVADLAVVEPPVGEELVAEVAAVIEDEAVRIGVGRTGTTGRARRAPEVGTSMIIVDDPDLDHGWTATVDAAGPAGNNVSEPKKDGGVASLASGEAPINAGVSVGQFSVPVAGPALSPELPITGDD